MKWFLLLVLLAGGAYAYWAYGQAHPQLAACSRFADLCGPDERKRCDDAFDGLLQVSSAADLAPSAQCMQKAQSCAEATGCLAGAAGKAGLNAAGQFLKGIGESITK